MALTAGTRLGVYEVTALIGEGGMGQVYRARDTKLNRDVALKILPDLFANDPDRLARLTREAQTLASLNHPYIAAIYGLEDADGVKALVMEFVEGDDLSQRIDRGAIAIDEALPIAKQIAEALEAAHEQGIIHRDLKPANIKVRPDGTVIVLDFGLAKAMEPAAGSSPSLSKSPTITTPAMTQAGMILGTAAYMSPEQARGKTVDKRSDIWAFGCVLFEMLTGKRAFPGEDVTDTLAAVVRAEPEWSLVPGNVSPTLLVFLRRSLQKDPKQRIGDIRDVRLALEGAFDVGAPQTATSAHTAPRRPFWRRAVPVAAAVVASVMVGAAAWTLKPAPPLAVTRFPLALGEGQQFTVTQNQMLAVSPDGTQLVYVANSQLYLRSMSDLEARPVPGTQQTASPYSPVFSPDGQSIAFYSQVDRAIKKIALSGGAAVTIYPTDAGGIGRVNWDASAIVFNQAGKGIMRVSANGGQPDVLVSAKDAEVMYGPQVLPGGEWLLFTLATAATADGWDKAQIVVQSLKSSERRTLFSGGSDARYLETGHLVYALGGVLFGVPFDLRQLAVTGGPVPIVEGVQRAVSGVNGVAQFSVSSTGSLVFIPGPVSASGTQRALTLFDRNGTLQPLKLPSGVYVAPRLSPDGRQIAVGTDDGKVANVWIADTSGTTAMRRLTFGGRNRYPVWSPDGQRLAFQSNREGDLGIFWQPADGTGPAERLTKAEAGVEHWPDSWSPDGAHISFAVVKGNAGSVWMLTVKERTQSLFAEATAKFVGRSAFSPDGRWVAYSSDETGRFEIFVQPYPPTGSRFQVGSPSGDRLTPWWSANGKELIFNEGATRWFAVSVSTQPSLTFGSPSELPRPAGILTQGPFGPRPYDMAADGQRVLAVLDASAIPNRTDTRPEIRVVLNWTEELKRLVPTK